MKTRRKIQTWLFTQILLLFLTTGVNLKGFAQTYLNHNREEVLLSFPDCTVADKYEKMVVFNCTGNRSVFYFQGEHTLCDLYAAEMTPQRAQDTLKVIIQKGFKMTGTRYVEPFLVSKANNHQKFPTRIYSNNLWEYCFMPISLTGKTAELTTVVVRLIKK